MGRQEKSKYVLVSLFVFVGVILMLYTDFPNYTTNCDPLDFSQGYAIINFQDPSGVLVPDVALLIQHMNNTNYMNVTSGALFYVPTQSYWFGMKEGYWNTSGVVRASQRLTICPIIQPPCPEPDLLCNSTYQIYETCPKDAVQVHIIAINGTRGNFSSASIPEGYQRITLAYNITGGYATRSAWGISAYIPTKFVPSLSYAANYSVTVQALWIGWNGSVTDYKVGGSDPLSAYDVGIYNSTICPPLFGSGEIELEGCFARLKNAVFYFGLLDDVTREVIPF